MHQEPRGVQQGRPLRLQGRLLVQGRRPGLAGKAVSLAVSEPRERARARLWLLGTAIGLAILMAGLIATGLVAKRRLVAQIEDDPQALLVNERFVTQTIDGHLEELGRELARIAKVDELTAALVANDRETTIEQL